MRHLLRIDLLDVPKIRGVIGAKEAMGATDFPAIESEFKRTHEVLPREDRVHFVPDDALTEIQPAFLQSRWVIAEVGIAPENIEGPTRLQHTGDVAEPGTEQAIKFLFG